MKHHSDTPLREIRTFPHFSYARCTCLSKEVPKAVLHMPKNLLVIIGPRSLPSGDIYFTFLFLSFPCDLLVIEMAATGRNTRMLAVLSFSSAHSFFVRYSWVDWPRRGKSSNSNIEYNMVAPGNWVQHMYNLALDFQWCETLLLILLIKLLQKLFFLLILFDT